MSDAKIREHVEEAEVALRGIRAILREAREGPKKLEQELTRVHKNEKARIAYRLSTHGVTADVIGKAFGLMYQDAFKLVRKGEILCHDGKTRDDMTEDVIQGVVNLWESGLFSNRAARCLRRADINTLADLCTLSLDELGMLPGIGTSTVREIEATLAEMGRKLKP